MKKCPFCKNEINVDVAQCPICKMILIEKIPHINPTSERVYTSSSPKEPKKQTHTSYYTPPQKSSSKERFKIPNGSGWIISIVGSIALTLILNGNYGSSNPLPAPLSDPTIVDTNLSLTPIPHTSYYSLPNGTVLFSSSLNGEGILSISNGTKSDAVVKLITTGGSKVYSVYVRANSSYSIENINDGIYRLLFSFGSNWDPNQNKFLVNPRAEAFDDTFDFETSDTKSTGFTITLNPVIDGKATTSPLDSNVFD